MNKDYDEREELLAEQLVAELEGQLGPAEDEEIEALSKFARLLPWRSVRPRRGFRSRLRRDLIEEARPRPQPQRQPWRLRWEKLMPSTRSVPQPGTFSTALSLEWGSLVSVVMVVLVLAIILIAILTLMGPRVRDIFGSVYNSITEGGGSRIGPHLDTCSVALASVVFGARPIGFQGSKRQETPPTPQETKSGSS